VDDQAVETGKMIWFLLGLGAFLIFISILVTEDLK
jgi:hypothetical protein